jgi:hypothetical protein
MTLSLHQLGEIRPLLDAESANVAHHAGGHGNAFGAMIALNGLARSSELAALNAIETEIAQRATDIGITCGGTAVPDGIGALTLKVGNMLFPRPSPSRAL